MALRYQTPPLCLAFLLLFLFQPTSLALGQEILPRILLGVETDDYPAVGIVGSIQAGGFCTGTLISPTHVLTAAHCAEVIGGPTSGMLELSDQVYQTIRVVIHPDYNSFTLANDIAILELSEPVVGVDPSPIFRNEPLVGDLLFIVGFGATGSGEGGSDGTFGIKRVGVTTIDEITEDLVSWIFDDTSESNTAAGDSGGPGYIDVSGELFVASITSGGTEPDSILGDVAFNTRVDAFADWIDATLAATSEPPPDSPGDEPGDDSSGGDPIWSQPFPILQLLIEFLTQLLDCLIQLQEEVEPTDPEPVEPPEEPTAPVGPVVETETDTTSETVDSTPMDAPAGESLESTESLVPAIRQPMGTRMKRFRSSARSYYQRWTRF